MDTLRSIMQKVDALTNEVALLKAQNKKKYNHQEMTPDGVALIVRNVVNQDYINKQYGK